MRNLLEQSNFTYNLSQQEKFYSYLSLFILAVFMFFVFFGTRLPFSEKITEIENIGTSNIVNQIVFGSLFVFSIILLIPKRQALYSFIIREKFFSVFLIWCGMTIIWSAHPFVSFKRYIQYIALVTVSLSVFLHVKDVRQIVSVFKFLFGVYLLISIATILTIPGALDRFGIWRGVSIHKNILGQMSLLALIFFSSVLNQEPSLKSRTINSFFLILALVLLIGSRSSTALFTFLILFGISFSFFIDKIFEPLGIRKTLSLLMIFLSTITFLIVIIFVPDIIASILGGSGKNLTLTGRVDLWADIWEEAQNHLVIGTGFQGYWVVTSAKIEHLFEIYLWFPTQAHNGYLDIINEVGIIGSVLFLFILINYYVNLPKLSHVQIWKWFVLAAIIVNFAESQFIRPKVVVGVMFVFSYFALFSDLLDQERKKYSDNPHLNNSYKSNSSFNHSNL